METLKVAVMFSSLETSGSKWIVNGSLRNLVDPLSPIIEDFRDTLHLNIQLVESTELITPGPNGTLRGMGGQIMSGEADLGAVTAIMQPYRAKAISFLHTNDNVFNLVHIYFKQPKGYLNQGMFILTPFTPLIWSLLFLTLIGILISTILIQYLDKTKANHFSDGDPFLWIVSCLTLRSFSGGPEGSSLRVATLIGMLFVTIIFSFYSAFIISKLTQRIELKSIEDLLKHEYRISGRPGGLSWFQLFPTEHLSLKQIESLNEEANRNFVSNEVDVTKIHNSDGVSRKNAGFFFTTTFYRASRALGFSDKEMCSVAYLEGTTKLPFAMLVAKGSPLKERLNVKIILIMERGLNKRYLRIGLELVVPKCDAEKVEHTPISLSNLKLVLSLLVFGLIFSLTLMLAELIWLRKMQK